MNEFENDSELPEEELGWSAGAGADVSLVTLLRLAEMGVSASVTLHVGGLVVTGQIIPYTEYYSALSDNMEAASTDPAVRAIAAGFRSAAEVIKSEVAEDDEEVIYTYIHLAEARFMSPTGDFIPEPGVVWRGKLSAVDGYIIGRIGSE